MLPNMTCEVLARVDVVDGRETYVHADGTASCSITDDVGADVGVGHGTQDHTGTGNQETSTISNTGSLRGQEHGVTDDNGGSGEDDEDLSPVEIPTESREGNSKDSSNGIRRNTVKLLLNGAVLGIDGSDDGREEESKTLDGDVVEEEDEGDLKSDGVGDTAPELDSIDTVNDFGLSKTLGLDTGDAKILLLLSEPSSSLGSIGEGDESEETETDGDDTLDSEDHSPVVKATEVRELENSTGQETTEGTSKRSHDHVERQTESQLRALIPTGEIVCDSGKHTSLKDTKKETNTANSGLAVDEGGSDTDDAEGERGSREEPAGTHPFTANGSGDLEDDV
jgi:hypothetical protein